MYEDELVGAVVLLMDMGSAVMLAIELQSRKIVSILAFLNLP